MRFRFGPADQIRRMLGRAARLAVAFGGSTRDRAKPVRVLVEKVRAAMATLVSESESEQLCYMIDMLCGADANLLMRSCTEAM